MPTLTNGGGLSGTVRGVPEDAQASPRLGPDRVNTRDRPDQTNRLERAVLATVLYSDLFDAALTEEECRRYLVGVSASAPAVAGAIDALAAGRSGGRGHLCRVGGFVCWRGREHLGDLRLRRQEAAQRLWPIARRYASWMRHVPFVRMVAVCGSLAVENADDDGDIDVFLITERGRVWWVQVAAMIARRLLPRGGRTICPNLLLSRGALRLGPPELNLGREIVQAAPLWGAVAYEQFRRSNGWVERMFPNLPPPPELTSETPDETHDLSYTPFRSSPADGSRPRLTAWIERLFGGVVGERIDRWLQRSLLAYYERRLRSRSVTRQQLELAYTRDRQVVVGGGYGPVVRRRFAERIGARLEFEPQLRRRVLDDLDPWLAEASDREIGQPVYERQFSERYVAVGRAPQS